MFWLIVLLCRLCLLRFWLVVALAKLTFSRYAHCLEFSVL